MKIKVTTTSSHKDIQDLWKQMDKVFKEVDKVYKEIDTKMTDPKWIEKTNEVATWEPYISWMPRKIGKKWYWHSPIYRKYQFSPGGGFWKYGTEFDVLRESK